MRKYWIILLLLLLAAPQAYSRPPSDSDWGSWYFLVNGTGTFVQWDHGREQMTVAMEPVGSRSGILLALPTKKEDVTLQWQDHIPVYQGRLPISSVHESLENILGWSCFTQIYLLPVEAILAPSLGRSATLPVEGPLDHDGLYCQAMDAASPAELEAKITREKINLPPQELKRIAVYADGKHSFVLLGLRSEAEYQRVIGNPPPMAVMSSKEHVPSLRFTFPAARPMLPAQTVATPEFASANNACVLGNVRLSRPAAGVRVKYFLGNQYPYIAGAPAAQPYTRVIRLNAPEELWFETTAPKRILATEFWASLITSWPFFLVVLALWTAACSYISGGVAGLLIAKKWRLYARLGLWNLTTLIGLAIAARRRHDLAPLQKRWGRRLYLLAFSLTFTTINFGADWLLVLAMGKYWPAGGGPFWPWFGVGG